jgi:dihydrofolate reductase
MSVELIYASDTDGLIGVDNTIPWDLPEDLKRFKEITTGHIVMMGRKTYESIGRPLPNRLNVVVTSRDDLETSEKFITCKDPINYIEQYREQTNGSKKLFIIGGQDLIGNVGFKHADVIHHTQIYKNFGHLVTDMNGIYVPNIPDNFVRVDPNPYIHTGKGLLTYNFMTYRRI